MKLSKQFIFIIGFALWSCTNSDPSKNSERIVVLCETLVDKNSSVAIALAMKVDTFIEENKLIGFANQTTKEPLNHNSKFRIASITKPITATAILQLIESNQLSFDDHLNSYFPNFPNGDHITIYHLLSHTSGIPNWWKGKMPKSEPSNFPMCDQPHTYIEQMLTTELFQPGTSFSYSNTGYVLLGEIIEIISSLTYEEYLKKHIFSIAGMKHTELEYIGSPSEEWITGYSIKNNEFSDPEKYHMPFSAGGLRSTSEDLMLFLEALENGILISKDMFAQMTSYARLNNQTFVYESLYSPNGDAIQFPNHVKKFGYGLGFQIIELFDHKVISHGGDIAGFNSVLILVPHNKVKVVILSNTENGIMPHLKKIEKLATSIKL